MSQRVAPGIVITNVPFPFASALAPCIPLARRTCSEAWKCFPCTVSGPWLVIRREGFAARAEDRVNAAMARFGNLNADAIPDIAYTWLEIAGPPEQQSYYRCNSTHAIPPSGGATD